MRKRSFPTNGATDFTSDSGFVQFAPEEEGKVEVASPVVKKKKESPAKAAPVAAVQPVRPSASDKNPCMMLNELKPGLIYECEESGDSPATKRWENF